MKLTFYGGAEMVTGSNYVLESGGEKIMVDCGLEQGSYYAERQNFNPFPYDPREIKAIFVTHAHLDHTGRLPKLYHDGFRGKVYSTPPTRDFAELVLLDSQRILNREAERENLPPLYTEEEVRELVGLWQSVPYHETVHVGNFTAEFFDAGHILGSSFIKITAEGKSVVFSGDLGNYPAPIIKRTEMIESADYCLLESTYGNREHEDVERRREMLEDVIEDAAKTKSVLMIPAFALERTQELLYHLNELFEHGRVPRIPVYIDSPLAIKITAAYKKYERYFNTETAADVRSGDDILNFPGLHLSMTPEDSRKINGVAPPKIIIAGSGMSHGGRILFHEQRYLSDPNNIILFVGYQATGSMGRKILEGAERVTIFGEEIPVRAQVRVINGYSAHADQPRLLEWLSSMKGTLKKIFLIHGEPKESSVLASKIRDTLALDAVQAKQGETVVL